MELVDLSIRGTRSSSKEEFARIGLEMEQVQNCWKGAGAGPFNNWFLVERANLAVYRGAPGPGADSARRGTAHLRGASRSMDSSRGAQRVGASGRLGW